jgi:hypothetical protein
MSLTKHKIRVAFIVVLIIAAAGLLCGKKCSLKSRAREIDVRQKPQKQRTSAPAETVPASSTSGQAYLDWDLSNSSHDASRVGWSTQKPKDFLDLKTVRLLHIKISPTQSFAGTIAHVFFEARNGSLSQVSIDLGPETLQSVTLHAAQIFKNLQIDEKGLSKWSDSAAKGDLSTFSKSPPTPLAPSVSVEITPAIKLKDDKWHIVIFLLWDN